MTVYLTQLEMFHRQDETSFRFSFFFYNLIGTMLAYTLRVDTAFFLIYERLNTTGFLTVEKSKLGLSVY